MADIAKTRRDELVYRLSQDQIAVHTRLKNIDPELGYIFLRPRLEGDYIYWEFEDRNIFFEHITPYTKLSIEDLSLVQQKLNEIKQTIQQNGDSKSILDIPSLDCIQLANTNVGKKLMIHAWGYLPWDNSRGTSIIDIKVPLVEYVEIKVKLDYWDNRPAINKPISVIDNAYETSHITDGNGEINLGKHLVGKELTLQWVPGNKIMIQANRENSFFTYTIPFYTDATIRVLDSTSRSRISNYKLSMYLDGNKSLFVSDEDGFVFLKNIEAGKVIEVSDGKINNKYFIENDDNNFEFIIESERDKLEVPGDEPLIKPPLNDSERKVSFTVLGLNGEALIDYKLDIRQSKKIINTDVDDKDPTLRYLSEKAIDFNAASEGLVSITEDGRISDYICKFRTKPDVYHYSFQIQKKRSWMWLLWLLAALLMLLIPFNKDIQIKVVDENKIGISKVQAKINYQYHSLFHFKKLKFFTTDSIERSGITDHKGEAKFSNNPTTLFDFIFKLKRNAKITIFPDSTCFKNTTALIKFYKIMRQHEILVNRKLRDYEILVLEKRTMRPIENASVVFKNSTENAIQLETNEKGKVLFKTLDVCSIAQEIYAYKFYNDYDTLYSNILEDVNFVNNFTDTLYIYEPEPCTDVLKNGRSEGEKILLSTPNPNKYYSIEYNFSVIPDRLTIRAFPSNDLIYDTGLKSGIGYYRFKPSEVCNGCKIVYLQIETIDPNTQWTYFFKCINN